MKKLILVLFFYCFELQARPVSYAGGWTVASQNNQIQNRVQLHYSPSENHSLGSIFIKDREFDQELLGFQWNYLLNRKNTKKSQRNLYLTTQLGDALGFESNGWANIGIIGDWETRKYFLSYGANTFYGDNFNEGEFNHSARIGIAPYIADYGSVHTWLILQLENRPERENELLVTPVIRLFRGDYLFEIGANTNSLVVNTTIRL